MSKHRFEWASCAVDATKILGFSSWVVVSSNGMAGAKITHATPRAPTTHLQSAENVALLLRKSVGCFEL